MPESQSSPGRRFCQIIGLKREQREYYLDLHRNIWPEIRENMKQMHIRNYSLHVLGDQLVQYFEYTGKDMEADFRLNEESEWTKKWEALCRPCHEPLPGRAKGEWWSNMQEVIHCP